MILTNAKEKELWNSGISKRSINSSGAGNIQTFLWEYSISTTIENT